MGFIGGFAVPKTIDSAPEIPPVQAALVDAGLLAVFALQHSIMARQWFKNRLTRLIPEPAERSTYVLASSLALIALFRWWQPIGGTVWNVETPAIAVALYAVCAAGWLLVLLATFLLNHFDLFGLRQVWLQLVGTPYTRLHFNKPLFYRFVRHPLYLGWLLAFWATPRMTAAHLLFAGLGTAYILVAIQFEERDLVRTHGEQYLQYRREVPMILPVRVRPSGSEAVAASQGD
jgi:protein-S-isoprenylcysteine O-methyltransferase Ste14